MLTAMIKKVMDFIRQAQEREDRKGDHLTEQEVMEFEVLARDVWLFVGELERCPEAKELLVHVDVEDFPKPTFVSDLNLLGDWTTINGESVFLFCAEPWMDHMERLHAWAKRQRKKPKQLDQKSKAGDDLVLAALQTLHKYGNREVEDSDPKNLNEIAEAAGVSRPTVSRYLKEKFGGHKKYQRDCEQKMLGMNLALLSGDVDQNFFNKAVELRAER